MSGERNHTKLRVFLASPQDVNPERERVHYIADELNRLGNIADEIGLTIEVLDWQTHVAPFGGRPEEVILQQLPVEKWDVFIGILWLRFGTATGSADPTTGKPFGSGTEEEFIRALSLWRKNEKPQILFYRCMRSPANLDELDPDQYKRITTFFTQFDVNNNFPALYQTFQTTEEFERRVRLDLTKLILKYRKEFLPIGYYSSVSEKELIFNEIEQRYFNFIRYEYGRIKLFGFLSRANIDVRLLDIFVALRFSQNPQHIEGGTWDQPDEHISIALFDEHLLTPPEILEKALKKKKLLLLLGGPGSGKTTLLNYFAFCCLDLKGRERINLRKQLIPILVPLRQIDPTKPFAESLAAWAETNNQKELTVEVFEHWLRHRGALVLLDGLDEISDLGVRRQICNWIDAAAPVFNDSTFIVTCRFTGYREAEGVALQTAQIRVEVLDFNTEQQNAFLKRWFCATLLEALDEHEANDPLRLQEVEQKAVRQAENVLEFLSHEENRSLREMASIPVLLQIIAIIWKEQDGFVGGRVELYNRCIDFLLDHRDMAKKIEPVLSAAQAKFVLRPLALWMHAEWQKDEAPREEIEKQISEKIQAVQPGGKASVFLDNIRDRAGVLVGSGADTFTFQHKSFREFLAALEIANRREVKLLVDNFGNDWWHEVLLFSAGITSPEIFSDFLECYLRDEKNAGPCSPLLLQLIRDAVNKPLSPFKKILGEQELVWQKRYNALKCVRLLRSEAAIGLVKTAQKDQEPKVQQLADQILLEWDVIKPPITASGKPDRFFNPIEGNAEYILIPHGAYFSSITRTLVQIPDLYFARYPVTNKLYKIFLAALPKTEQAQRSSRFATDKRFKGDDQPVVGVTWYDAMAYCEWLTRQLVGDKSFVFRLPTEDEWEWAAGNGHRKYPWGDEIPDSIRANYKNTIGQTTTVGSYPAGATPEGLMDVAGNILEWMRNKYNYAPDHHINSHRATRGGSWESSVDFMRCSANNFGLYELSRNSDLGFRVVCS